MADFDSDQSLIEVTGVVQVAKLCNKDGNAFSSNYLKAQI
jgi:hypothetical protein